MNGRRGAAVAVTVATSLAAWAAPAVAEKPEWAGPPTAGTFDLVDDPLSLQCGDRDLVFTEGQVVFRTRMLPDGRIRDTRLPVGATAVDQFGTTYRLHGSAGSDVDPAAGSGTFRLTGAVIGPAGTTETVNSRFDFQDDAMTATERGTCTVVFA